MTPKVLRLAPLSSGTACCIAYYKVMVIWKRKKALIFELLHGIYYFGHFWLFRPVDCVVLR